MSDLTPYGREVLKEIAQPGSGKDLGWGMQVSSRGNSHE
jgi:hypothetical protein